MKYLLLLGLSICLGAVLISAADKAVCHQKKEVGPCRASQPQFFYNPEIQDCDFFLYGGCRGNDNRFSDISECRRVCLNLTPDGEEGKEESNTSEEIEDKTEQTEDLAESEASDSGNDA